MKWVFALTLLAMAAPPLSFAGPIQPKPLKSKRPQSKEARTSTHLPPGKSSSRTASARSVRRSSSRSGHRARVAAAPSYQLHPDPDRYQDIQKALADRGYFKGEVNGTWGDDSVDALRRFQADQKLDNDGKINALTLSGLGLGPKHDGLTGISNPASPATTLLSPASTPSVGPRPPAANPQ